MQVAHTLSEQEQERYRQQLVLPEISVAGQMRLKNARVVCIGAGGLANAALPYLVAAGVGHITLVDGDSVVLSNLGRQILYVEADVGYKKTSIAQYKLQQINPNVCIDAVSIDLTEANAEQLLVGADIVLDATDHFASHFLIHDVCHQLQIPVVFAGVERYQGMCSLFYAPSKQPCMRCWLGHLSSNPPIATCANSGVLGVLPGLLGMMQATEVLKWLLNLGEPLLGRVILVDALSARNKELQLSHDPACPLCVDKRPYDELTRPTRCPYMSTSADFVEILELSPQQFTALGESPDTFHLIDVRQPHEHAQGHLGGVCIPLPELALQLNDLTLTNAHPILLQQKQDDLPIVVYCQHGIRSRQASQLLQEAGFRPVLSLQGGYAAMNDHAKAD